MSNIFELASMQQLRFASARGELSTEQLWELPLTSKSGVSLDGIAIAISRQIKESETESFVTETTGASRTLTLKLEILKHIIKHKQEQNSAKIVREANLSRRREIEDALAAKKSAKIQSASEEELLAELAAMQAS